MFRLAHSGSLHRWQQVPIPVHGLKTTFYAAPLATTTVSKFSSQHAQDTLHVQKNGGRKVSPVPPVIQGFQPRFRQASPVKEAQSFLKNQEDRTKNLRDKIQQANRQGSVYREFHTTSSKHSTHQVCGTADEWDEDMACVLQGSCLPGSTQYCRTKSMFGKLNLNDIMQGTTSITIPGVRRYSTASTPTFIPVRRLHNRLSHSVGRTYEAWDEDLATQVPVPNKPISDFKEIPKIDKATRQYYCTEPGAQFVESGKSKFGDVKKRSYHTGDIVPVSQRMGRTFETWDEDVAHMLHNLDSKPVFGRPRKDIRPPADPPKVYVPVSYNSMVLQTRHCHTSPPSVPQASQRDRLKQAFRDYGATVVIFHVSISLISLGGFYLAVSRYRYILTQISYLTRTVLM